MTKTGGDPNKSTATDLKKWFDPAAGRIESATGEIVWDYRREVCSMKSPNAQGMTKFLKLAGGTFKFPDVTIESANDYDLSVLIVGNFSDTVSDLCVRNV